MLYIFTFLILLLSSIIESFEIKKISKTLFVFLIFYLIIHDGMRWEIGTDWKNYNEYFNNCLNSGSNTMSFSIGYVIINVLVRTISDSYTLFLFVHAFIVYGLLAYSIYRLSPKPIFSLLLYYGMMLPYLGMNRQIIALVICLFSLLFLLKEEKKKFILGVIIASLFHTSCLLFLVALFLRKEIKTNYLIISLTTVIVLALFGLVNKLPLNIIYIFASDDPMSTINKIGFYAENNFLDTNIIFTVLAIFKRLIWLIITFFIIRYTKLKNNKLILFFNLYFFGSLVYILFNNTILQIIVARGLIYFNIFEIFVISYILLLNRNILFRTIIISTLTVYSYIGVLKGFNFYKEDLGEDIFRPYKSILSN